MNRFLLLAGTTLSMLSVILGAFGTHSLKNTLSPDLLENYRTAVQIPRPARTGTHPDRLDATHHNQPTSQKLLRYAGISLLTGILLFSGSLYTFAISGQHWLVYLTPIGGLCLIAG